MSMLIPAEYEVQAAKLELAELARTSRRAALARQATRRALARGVRRLAGRIEPAPSMYLTARRRAA